MKRIYLFFVDIEEGLRVVATLLTFVVVFWWFVFEIMNEGSLWQPTLTWHLLLYMSGFYDGWSER